MTDNIPENTIYKDFCNGMKNQSREQIRLAGDIAKLIPKAITSTKQTDHLQTLIPNFCQIDTHLENIETNLNKVCALARYQK